MPKFRVTYTTKKVTEVEAENMDYALAEAVTLDTSDNSRWVEDNDDYIIEEIMEWENV